MSDKQNIQLHPARAANNFDIIRILFAWLVIISHAYILSGSKQCDWVCEATNHYINFSYFGVKGFITISGFLIFKSLERSPNPLDYLWKRVIRIYPGLIIVLGLSIVMAYLIYKPENNYFNFKSEAIDYFLNNLTLYHNQWRIHGVFDNNANTAINGSLWTMGFEFFFYLVLLLLFPIRHLKKILMPTLLIGIVILMYGNLFHINDLRTVDFKLRVDLIFELGAFFLAGSFWGMLDWSKMKYENHIFIATCISMGAVIAFKLNPIWLCLSWPYIVLYIGQKTSKLAGWIHENIEDPSFGIYLYAFPVQQLIIYFFKPSVFVLLWTSTIVSFALGIISWKWIEKKILKWKNLFAFGSK
jgi:peptidoglycan/LPS O-acetylase OafA/YrhL